MFNGDVNKFGTAGVQRLKMVPF